MQSKKFFSNAVSKEGIIGARLAGFIISFVIIMCVLIGIVVIHKDSAVTNVKKYGKWDNREIQGTLKIFPDSLEGLGAEKYYYKCTEGILDSKCQIYLQCKMTEEKYDSEKERLSKISDTYEGETQEIMYDTDNFNYPAYVTVYNFDDGYEYALLDEEQNRIYYIHLRFVPEEDIAFEPELLPKNYDYLSESQDEVSMYAHWLEDIQGWYLNN